MTLFLLRRPGFEAVAVETSFVADPRFFSVINGPTPKSLFVISDFEIELFGVSEEKQETPERCEIENERGKEINR